MGHSAYETWAQGIMVNVYFMEITRHRMQLPYHETVSLRELKMQIVNSLILLHSCQTGKDEKNTNVPEV